MTTHEEASAPTLSTRNAEIYGTIPLPIGNSSTIRLLEILNDDTNDDDEPISCSLRLASLDEEFVALSYMWGPEAATKSIKLNGESFLVRRNLWDFLRQRRMDQSRGTESRCLWIDALCIDQTSNLERNHQVGIMGRIYSRASKVLIWLGPARDDYSRAMMILADLILDPETHTVYSPSDLAAFEMTGNPAFAALLQDPYWSRAWIVQECVLAAELELQCGPTCIPAPIVDKIFAVRARQFPSRLIVPVQLVDEHPKSATGRIFEARGFMNTESRYRYIVPWGIGIEYWPRTNCADPRDRVYAMTALMDPALKISPDYNKSAETLFVEIVDKHIIGDALYESKIIKLARLLDLEHDGPDHASWSWLVWQKLLEAEREEQASRRISK
ncbi:uncharacterized protein EKO05_0010881 [Ascochyta rabiei]|uniref:uncharacterized protein n=1 Tax=Didymella rabiei TaxID=5454 RepID=UPI0019029BA1|nr:uncharacterized protein EKO05_0010881 [Ascochyta rabiei]UPX20655.1 hypothetical protein EKO05_0010881 [Ascochyta rabiei]